MRKIVFKRLFSLALIAKGLNGLVELAGATILLFVSSTGIQQIVYRITAHEIAEDPTDILAHILLTFGQTLGATRLISILYLFVHGVVKILIAYFLMKESIRIYPWAIGVLVSFAGYQAYLTWRHFSWAVLALALLDIVIITMAAYEYRLLKKRVATLGEPRDEA